MRRSDDSPEDAEASGPDMSKYAINDAMLDVISNHRGTSARDREQPRADNQDLAEMSLQEKSVGKAAEKPKAKFAGLDDIDDILQMNPGNPSKNLGIDLGMKPKPKPQPTEESPQQSPSPVKRSARPEPTEIHAEKVDATDITTVEDVLKLAPKSATEQFLTSERVKNDLFAPKPA